METPVYWTRDPRSCRPGLVSHPSLASGRSLFSSSPRLLSLFFIITPYGSFLFFAFLRKRIFIVVQRKDNEKFLSVQFSSIDYIHIVVCPVSRTFLPAELKLYPLNSILPTSPLPQPQATTTLLSVSVNSTPLGTSYKWNHAVFVFHV